MISSNRERWNMDLPGADLKLMHRSDTTAELIVSNLKRY